MKFDAGLLGTAEIPDTGAEKADAENKPSYFDRVIRCDTE